MFTFPWKLSKTSKVRKGGHRIKNKKRRTKKEQETRTTHIKFIFALAAFAFCIIGLGFFLSEKYSTVPCETKVIKNRLVVLLDKSTAFTEPHRRIFDQEVLNIKSDGIEALKNQVPPGTYLTVYEMTDNNTNAPEPKFEKCRPLTSDEFKWFNFLIRGHKIADNQFIAKFQKPLHKAVVNIFTGPKAKSTPILEMLSQLSVKYSDTEVETKVILFSTLKQNSIELKFSEFCKAVPFKRGHPPSCGPMPQKQPCPTKVECKQQVRTCMPQLLCMKSKVKCGEEPKCSNPTRTCYGSIPAKFKGINPYPNCSCTYFNRITKYKSDCEKKVTDCIGDRDERLRICRKFRDVESAECDKVMESAGKICREEDAKYQKRLRQTREGCETIRWKWDKEEDAREGAHAAKQCKWDSSIALESFKKKNPARNDILKLTPKAIDAIKFVLLKASTEIGNEEWRASFWREYADTNGILKELYRQQ